MSVAARLLALVLALLALAGPGQAQQIAVRSGEHDGFSRLVFMYPAGTSWSVEAAPGGLRLSTPSSTFRYNLADVFRFIPKTRILSVEPALDKRSVFIATSDAVHPDTFQLPIGAVVLDVVDGAQTPPLTIAEKTIPSFKPQPKNSYLDLFWSGRTATEAPTQEPVAAAQTPAAENPLAPALSLPDSRVEAAERELFDQLGRAASQGLIELELPAHAPAAAAEGGETSPPPAESAPLPEDHLALRSQTVIDRDTASGHGGVGLAANGHSCLPDAEFDLQAWLSDKPATEQIASARRDLVGEFDRPRIQGVETLARTYLALGMGTEAKALYRVFGLAETMPQSVALIASILDGIPYENQTDLQAFVACDGKVALWAVLALEAPPKKGDVNFGALLRAFSALPPPIREIVGARLSARLIEVGAADVAATVRSMLARAPVEPQESLRLVDAQIGLSEGRATEAAELLDSVAAGNSEVAANALALAIETRLSQKAAIAQEDVENAGALARELAQTPLGYKLKRAEILGLGSTGQFDDAFASLTDWPEAEEAELLDQTRNDLFVMLATVPDDDLFVTTYFGHKDLAESREFPSEIEVLLANRLTSSGFWQSARNILSPSARRTDEGKLALARAALTGRDAAAALAYLTQTQGEAAAALRGEALSMLGKHDNAEGEFARAGDVDALVEEAWRSGNWPLVAQKGSEAQKQFLALFDAENAPGMPSDAGPPLGPLTEAQRLIERSASERDAFQQLMQELTTN